MLRYALFDLDNTLYPQNSGLWEAIGERINSFMIDRLGLDPTLVSAQRKHYLEAFGTTLNGLRREFEIDPEDFLQFVHDLPLENYIRHDAALDGMLARLPLEKFIFTNADEPHARRVLLQLGIAHHFEDIFDIYALDFINKPLPLAYEKVLVRLDADAKDCVMVEDSHPNLEPALRMGMLTVLLQSAGKSADGDHHQITQLTDLEPLLQTYLIPETTES